MIHRLIRKIKKKIRKQKLDELIAKSEAVVLTAKPRRRFGPETQGFLAENRFHWDKYMNVFVSNIYYTHKNGAKDMLMDDYNKIKEYSKEHKRRIRIEPAYVIDYMDKKKEKMGHGRKNFTKYLF